MRILHTADWHLGDRLGRIDRTDDIRRAVERVAAYCRDESIDVLIIAGDLFSESARADGLRDAVQHLRDTFVPFLQNGGTILAVTGNHDNENFCQTLRHAMSLAAPGFDDARAVMPPGRLYLAAEPALLKLADAQTGGVVQFLLMPFPTPAVFLSGEADRRFSSLAEKNDCLRAAFLSRLTGLLAEPRFDRSAPSVLVAHAAVAGADLSNRFRISEEADVVIDEPSWPATFAYVALGHIHKPQAIGGHGHVRYSGSLERFDLGEAADEKSIVLVEIGAKGLSAAPQTRPLDSTPIYRLEIIDCRDIDRLAEQHADRAVALVNLQFSYDAGRDDLLGIQRRLDELFPRWYARDWWNRGDLGPTLTLGEAAAKTFEDSVHDYLNAELVNHAEAERASLIELADRYLQEQVVLPS